MGQGTLLVFFSILDDLNIKKTYEIGKMERAQWTALRFWIEFWKDGVQADIQKPKTSRRRNLHYQGYFLLVDS